MAHSCGGPDLPCELGAVIRQEPWPGGGTVAHLRLFLGRDEVDVWPADPQRIEELGCKLLKIARELRNSGA